MAEFSDFLRETSQVLRECDQSGMVGEVIQLEKSAIIPSLVSFPENLLSLSSHSGADCRISASATALFDCAEDRNSPSLLLLCERSLPGKGVRTGSHVD